MRTRRQPGLDRITAWAGVVAAGLLVQGGVPRVARGESGLARALSTAQFEDGGLISRIPYEQMLLVDRLGLLRGAYFAAKQSLPDAHRSRRSSSARRASWRHHGRRRAVELAGRQSRRSRRGSHALVEGCGLRARPLRQARGWGYQRLSALGTDPRHRRRPAAAAENGGVRLRLDPGVRNVGRRAAAGGQLRRARRRSRPNLPADLVEGLRTTAAHTTLVLADTNSTAILPDGSLGKGVEDVAIERSEDNDCSRLEASHDGYVRGFGLVHKRSLMLGNDGKELRGADQLIAEGPAQDPRRGALCGPLPPRARSRGDHHRRRHGRDPSLARRAAVEFPLPRRHLASRKA